VSKCFFSEVGPRDFAEQVRAKRDFFVLRDGEEQFFLCARSRLMPVVDRVVMEGSSTDGLHFVRRAVREVAGTIDVRILKPDTAPRTLAVDTATMVTFCRG
jgi:hypothetical protein